MKRPGRMFAFRLCLALGVIHPDYLEAQLTSRQMAEWAAYYNLVAFGADVTHEMLARMTAYYVQAHSKPGAKSVETNDFRPRPKRQTPEEMQQILTRALSGLHGSH